MRKHEPDLDWRTLAENAEWPPVERAPISITTTRRPLRRRSLWWVSALLAILLPALVWGYLEVCRADQAMTGVEDEVRATVAADGWVARQKNPTSGATNGHTHAAVSAPEQGIEARSVEVRGDYAMVEVWTETSDISWLPAPYRQTRFYQATAQGWQLSDPPDLFWQPLDTLQVGRFTFVYGAHDADAMLATAAQVEAVDAELRAEVGLAATDKALTVKVIAQPLPSLDPVELMRVSDGTTLYAPSPALLSLPTSLSEGDALLQLIAGVLIQRDLDEALAGRSSDCGWAALTNGLRLGLLREHSEIPSQSLAAVETFVRHRTEYATFQHLAWLGSGPQRCSLNSRGSYANNSVAFALVEYLFSTYGRDRLPTLIDGIRRFDSWETLIPAVVGISAAEFEADWQDYLRSTYPSPDAD